jgi:hypothetical protein
MYSTMRLLIILASLCQLSPDLAHYATQLPNRAFRWPVAATSVGPRGSLGCALASVPACVL